MKPMHLLKAGNTQPLPGDVHVNTPLSNISIAYVQDAGNFVADQVFPNLPVTKQSDRYYTYDRGYFWRNEMEERAAGAESAGSGYTLDSTPTYYAPVYAFHHDVTDQRRANSDNQLDPDKEATIIVTQKGLIKRETLFATRFMSGGVWTNDWAGVAAGPTGNQVLQWNDANSNPIEDIRSAKTTVLESTGFEPNTLVIGQRVFDKLIDHPDIVDRVKYGQTSGPAQIDVAELIALLKIQRIFVMKAVQNTGKEGEANAHSFIGGKKALLCYSTPTPGLMTPTAGYTFSWTGYLGASTNGMRIKKFRMEPNAADRVEIEASFDQKLVAADLGFFWNTIVA